MSISIKPHALVCYSSNELDNFVVEASTDDTEMEISYSNSSSVEMPIHFRGTAISIMEGTTKTVLQTR